MSRIIRGKDGVGAQPWPLPDVERSGPAPAPDYSEGYVALGGKLPTAKDIETIQQQAYEESYQKGYQEGMESARAELSELGKRLRGILDSLAEPLQSLDELIEQQLLELSLAIARQIIRREINIDPSQIVAVVREAVKVLPAASNEVTLHLHPDDAAVLRNVTSEDERANAWHVVEDPAVAQGGCEVFTKSSHIDATLDHQIARVAASIFGGHRSGDGGADTAESEQEP